MSSFFGLPCEPPPDLGSVFFPLSEAFSQKLFLNPQFSEMHQFWTSGFFVAFFLWYVVFRVPREYSRMISAGLGAPMGLVTLFNVVFVFEVFRRHGYECTVFFCILLYLVYFFLLSLVPVAARTPAIADVLPEIKELPAAQKEPGLNHCRRLAICRHSPVFDNHLFQWGKHAKCVECAAMGSKGFRYDASDEQCQSSAKSNDPSKCYKCAGEVGDTDECTLTEEECADVTMVLDLIDPPRTEVTIEEAGQGRQEVVRTPVGTKYNRQEACRAGRGSLCWFKPAATPAANTLFFGWKGIGGDNSARPTYANLSDPAVNLQGYPTKQICEDAETANDKECVKAAACKEDALMLARCACDQYMDAPSYSDPCEFLKTNCDMDSIAYQEAEMKMRQAQVDVSDIVSVGDVRGFLGKLDDVSKKIP